MNELSLTAKGYLGSEEDAERIASAERASVMIISDTHGHYGVFEAIVREFGPQSDVLLFAGDGMWDVAEYVENALENERLRDALPPLVCFVAGNGDGDSYRVGLPSGFSESSPEEAPGRTIPVPSRQVVRVAGSSILLVHGHRHSVDVSPEILVDSARALDCDVAVFGHTHVPFFEEYGKIAALNPGSAARPRGGSSAGFAVLQLDRAELAPRADFYIANQGLMGRYWFDSVYRQP